MIIHMNKSVFSILLVSMFLSINIATNASAVSTDEITRIFIDGKRKPDENLINGNIFIEYSNGKVRKLTKSGLFSDPKISTNKKYLGWLEGNYFEDRGEQIYLPTKLHIYSNRKAVRTFEASFIRSWGFWNNDTQIVIYFGGLHFAGRYELYDLSTGIVIAHDEDAPKYDWSISTQN